MDSDRPLLVSYTQLLVLPTLLIFVINYQGYANVYYAFLDLTIKILQEHESVVKAIYTGSEYITTATGDEDFGLVLESTSFYAEQGGQVHHVYIHPIAI